MENQSDNSLINHIEPVGGLYKNWFLDYASYVILERAIPLGEDGLKPVQRRILHAMKEMDDGRYHKVANIIGQSMQYHPHGDAGISDALINIGQKNLLIDTQGNWGDTRTGDNAAAPRYIEARLSPFAKDIIFNPKTTKWQLSYDGRKKEPIALPAKFPLLLFQGTDGIAVGLSTKILPHNFCEIIDASITHLKGKKFKLYPDFSTGGTVDVTDYQQGKRGGRIRTRAKIDIVNNKNLVIRELPFGVTTTQLCESIIKANDQNKIKIKKVTDNTAEDVEIEIESNSDLHPQLLIDALYAFTHCETKIATNACVIIDQKPQFLSVNDLLIHSVEHTKELLAEELRIRIHELKEEILYSSLEKIFIEKRIYRDIEEQETWEAVLQAIDNGLEPYKIQFYRTITQEDIIKLTEIKIKKISKYNTKLADEKIKSLNTELEESEENLKNLVEYTITFYENILTKYGKGRERKTEIISFDDINVKDIVINNTKIYVDRKEGFIGSSLKKEEFLTECSDLDEIIVFTRNCQFKVVKVQDKVFIDKDIIHARVFKKNDDRTTYNYIYADAKSGISFTKRFQIKGITRDKLYSLAGDNAKHCKVLYFSEMPNGESEKVKVLLSPNTKARIKDFIFDFKTIAIKNRSSIGNRLSKYAIRKIVQTELGNSTLEKIDMYYNPLDGRFNTDENGINLGYLTAQDTIIAFYNDGNYEMFEFANNLKLNYQKTLLVEKHEFDKVYAMIYYNGDSKVYYAKRFVIDTHTKNALFSLIKSEKERKVAFISAKENNEVLMSYSSKGKNYEKAIVLEDFVSVKNAKALGNKVIDIKTAKFKKVIKEM